MFREGLLVVVSGPSGSGKSTILEAVKKKNDYVKFSVSATSRRPREGEVEGQSYFYKSVDEFKRMIDNDEFVEWVVYCDNYYGTPKNYIDDCKKSGFDVLLDIEVEGAINIKEKFPDSVLIFILPPSMDELKRRIVGRGTEKEDVIEKRLNRAKNEITLVDKYDYVVINDDVEKAANFVSNIITAEKLKLDRNSTILQQIGFNSKK